MTKVHAFLIKSVGHAQDWMFADPDDHSGSVHGHNPKEVERVDADMMGLFQPQPGHYCIKWPHGLVTFRDPESFAKDFRYLSGTVYETELEALFQKGMMSEEGQAQLAVEREERKRVQEAQWALQREAIRKRAANPIEQRDGYVVRHVVPGLLAVPEPMVQPRFAHVSLLPIVAAMGKPFS